MTYSITKRPTSLVLDVDPGWVNPNNIKDTSITTFAMAEFDSLVVPLAITIGTNFSFNLPTSAIIRGFQLDLRVKDDSSFVADTHIYLYDSINYIGNNKAIVQAFPSTPTIRTFGGPTDLWGISPTVSQVNSSGFGNYIGFTYVDLFDPTQVNWYDYQFTVYYDIPRSAGSFWQVEEEL